MMVYIPNAIISTFALTIPNIVMTFCIEPTLRTTINGFRKLYYDINDIGYVKVDKLVLWIPNI